MSSDLLWRITVTTAAEAEDAVVSLLEDLFAEPAAVFSAWDTPVSRVTVYCADRSAWGAQQRQALRAGLERVRACGLSVGAARFAAKRIHCRAWADSWRHHFRPLEIGPRLLIKPSWSRRRPRPNQEVVVLDPGLSFGTGRHPTTAFCLRQLARCRKPREHQAFLDLGTGSGILAIAAARLGYSPVHAVDNDALAVRVARANARQNGVARRLVLRQQDLARLPRSHAARYHVICANLTVGLLTAHARRITRRLHPGGRLVLAGILAPQFAAVQRTFEAAGLRLRTSRVEKEWRSGAFELGCGRAGCGSRRGRGHRL